MSAQRRLGFGFLFVGALWAAYKIASAIQRGPGGVPQPNGGPLQELINFLPGLTLVVGVLLVLSGGRKKVGPEKRWIWIMKVLVGSWVGAGGAFIVMQMAALAFFGSAGVKRLYDYYSPIILALATVICLILVRTVKRQKA